MTRLRPLPTPAARLTATGLALPHRRWSNDALLTRVAPNLSGPRREAMLDAIGTQLGGRTRHHLDAAHPDEGRDGLVQLTVRAAVDAIACVPGLRGGDIAMHLHATSTPSRWTTPESARVGRVLARTAGMEAAFADIRAGCTGGLHALFQGMRYAADLDAPVLITAADRFSHIAPPTERFAPFVFGDGAVAAIAMPGAAGDGYALEGTVLVGRAEHADLATVAAELPPQDDDPRPWHLTGDAEAFDVAAREALGALALHFDVTQDQGEGPVIVSTTRKATAVALAGARAYTEALANFGHLGTASLVAGLHHLLVLDGGRPPSITLLAAGGGLSAGGARLVRRGESP